LSWTLVAWGAPLPDQTTAFLVDVPSSEVEHAALTCQPPPPEPAPCYRSSCFAGEWIELPLPAGSDCEGGGGICASDQVCVPRITTPAINNIFMYSPTQTAFDETCGHGAAATTTMLQVSIDNSPLWVTLPDTCTYFGDGRRYDSYNVRGGQSRCYSIAASNGYGSATGTTRCFTTPEDLVAPTPPTGSVTPWVGQAVVHLVDRSTNETQLRVYGRRANQNAPWQPLCVIERYNADHVTGFPHAGTGDSYDCGMDNLTLGIDYEVMLEAYHDHAERSSTTILSTFQTLPPVPDGPLNLRTLSKTNDSVSIRWDASQYATAYKVYASGPGGGAVHPIATITGTTFTATSLQSSKYYCFEGAALNGTGEGVRHSNDCETTYGTAPTKIARDLTLFSVSGPTGQVFSRGSLALDGVVDFLELRAEDNGATFAGLVTSKAAATKVFTTDLVADDCRFSSPGAAFLDADGVLQGAKLAAIYGGDHPFLREMRAIGGCPLFTSTMPAPNLTVIVHYTGYGP
jgi:hypothetical protein